MDFISITRELAKCGTKIISFLKNKFDVNRIVHKTLKNRLNIEKRLKSYFYSLNC